MSGANVRLHRYWIELERESGPDSVRHCFSRFGVTAFTLDDALGLVSKWFFADQPLPPVKQVIEDVDVSTLDPNHILPNIGVCVWRGIWYPGSAYEDRRKKW